MCSHTVLVYHIYFSAARKIGSESTLLKKATKGPNPKAVSKVPIPTIPPKRKQTRAHVPSHTILHQKYGIFFNLSSAINDNESYGETPKSAF